MREVPLFPVCFSQKGGTQPACELHTAPLRTVRTVSGRARLGREQKSFM